MGVEPRWARYCRFRPPLGARVPATTVRVPPNAAVVADLRGLATALRVGRGPSSGQIASAWPPVMVPVGRRGSDSAAVRSPDFHQPGAPDLAPAAEEDLVDRARTDPDAFAELYRRYVNNVHAFAYRRSRSLEVADEITSSTFERALRALPGFRWREGGFKAWLYRIAANELASYYRRHQRLHTERGQRAAQQLHNASTAADDPPVVSDHSELLLDALGTLNERYQRVITLRYLAGLSPDEAAQTMDMNKATLAVVLHRALGALRRAMDDLGHTDRVRA